LSAPTGGKNGGKSPEAVGWVFGGREIAQENKRAQSKKQKDGETGNICGKGVKWKGVTREPEWKGGVCKKARIFPLVGCHTNHNQIQERRPQ